MRALTLLTALALNADLKAAEPRLLDAREIRVLLREAAERALPEHVEITDIHYRGALALRGEVIDVNVEAPERVRNGRASLRATLLTPEETKVIQFAANLRAAGQAPIVRRGDDLEVIARSGGVTVSTNGRAQQDGAIGHMIHVLCPSIHRVLIGRIVSPSTVEIDLGSGGGR